MNTFLKKSSIFTEEYWVSKSEDLSITRILCFVIILFITGICSKSYLYSFARKGYPKNTNRIGEIETLVRDFGDERVFYSFRPSDDSAKKVAWISGSSGIIHTSNGYEYLHNRVVNEISEYEDCHAIAIPYVCFSNRLFETFISINDSLQYSPDYIVVALHPYYSFDSRTILYRNYFKSDLLKNNFLNRDKLDIKSAVLISLSFLEPSDYIKSFISIFFNIKEYQENYVKIQRKFVRNFGLTKTIGMYDSAQIITKKELEWNVNRYNFPYFFMRDAGKFLLKNDKFIEKYNSTMINGDGFFCNLLLTEIVNLLGSSGIPSLIYVAPLSPDAMDSDQNKVVTNNRVERMSLLNNLTQFKNLSFVESIPEEIRCSINYLKKENGQQDYIHLGETPTDIHHEKLSSFIARHLFFGR